MGPLDTQIASRADLVARIETLEAKVAELITERFSAKGNEESKHQIQDAIDVHVGALTSPDAWQLSSQDKQEMREEVRRLQRRRDTF